jgi:serine/threonine protein phosphatase PrpC
MGGHNAGSRIKLALETSKTSSARRKEKDHLALGLDVNLSFHGNRLCTAIKLANRKVFKTADSQEEYTGMGTTVVTGLVAGNVLTVGWAGDSRAYLFRGGALSQLSRDDSWVTAAWSEGILTVGDQASAQERDRSGAQGDHRTAGVEQILRMAISPSSIRRTAPMINDDLPVDHGDPRDEAPGRGCAA